DKVEPILAQDVKVGSPSKMMVMVSPDGPSGMKDGKGNPIKYPETEIFMWRIGSNGELSSYTLIVDDFKSEKCKKLLIELGVEE
ncbi:hypothetical protein, partial [Salmonella sp. SAL4435]|uniref:hypothetical protein n=1 Tax=Salmonella sp. SAL4435 TaxID=3159890 RepID=UPI00397929F7